MMVVWDCVVVYGIDFVEYWGLFVVELFVECLDVVVVVVGFFMVLFIVCVFFGCEIGFVGFDGVLLGLMLFENSNWILVILVDVFIWDGLLYIVLERL